ncbi:MAG: hydantoinase/oxoprolinase family protein [Alphaproteobacteria bacterium]|nr:hydantoinase/oxoprolinase family protein [Alphaproteobacteria bacterium]
MAQIALDIGGTFTDFVLRLPERGTSLFWKVPTSPGDPTVAVLDGLDALLRHAGVAPAAVTTVLHATTVATNAIIERKGAPTALITTEGFRDVIIMGRQKRYDTFDLYLKKPTPLVRRRDVFEVKERVRFDGQVLVPLAPLSLDAAVAAVIAGGYRSIAVALIHSYANPAHEERIAAALHARDPELAISLSSQVSPKMREYERFSTTVANAYVMPVVGRYVRDLQAGLKGRGITSDLFIMQSNAGLVPPELAGELPIRIVESGPAAGVMMCAVVGRREGSEHVITFDMGGTTAKLGAIDDGEPAVMPSFEVATVNFRPGSGLPLNVPSVELLEIGAGGGSLAGTDMGLVTVGPESAGADPGPICYGRGGARPTVTDANLVLGYLDPDYFNGGAMRLDTAAATAGIQRQIAEPLGLSAAAGAWGIHAVANSNMERAMRVVSVERGRDPRRYAMVAFGGAGPLHAARLARALGIPRVIVPVGAGVGSAVGLLAADSRIDVAMTRVLRVTADASAAIARLYTELEARAQAQLARLGSVAGVRWSRAAYMRFVGQGYERRVDLPAGDMGGDYAARVVAAFQETYRRNYGYVDREASIEGIDWTLAATVPSPAGSGGASSWAGPVAGQARLGERPAFFPEAGGFVPTPIIDRYRVASGDVILGPAIVEERECTTVILPGDSATVSAAGNLIIAIGSGD